ncbi:hypothetical protein BCR44DRAFT_1427651 [Catenaria anguillulae PL171]|uniref:Uncharacterized protein n=1 Tax=Catenaria anguillulae PL171 TaxID=765915 RepID=A0A1Y2HW16_9FUNG|nr:hypothetical protein BCR44DRAFT_1427651 [Catenaria anguillulae PL171]
MSILAGQQILTAPRLVNEISGAPSPYPCHTHAASLATVPSITWCLDLLLPTDLVT